MNKVHLLVNLIKKSGVYLIRRRFFMWKKAYLRINANDLKKILTNKNNNKLRIIIKN